MELSEIYERLKTLDIPVTYLKFDTPQELPFVVYYESGASIEGADNLNLFRRVNITIALYCDKKTPKLERQIESLFPDIPLEKAPDAYLPDENMLMVEYTLETIQDIQEVE